MSCIVIGSGIAGLSVAYHLQSLGIKVTVYSVKEKKAASNIFTGILYKYPGRWGRKSKYSDEAYMLSKSLIKEVESKTDEKVIVSYGVIKKFTPRLKKFSDVIMDGDNGYIKEGITIDMRNYCKGLRKLIGEENFVEKEVTDLNDIKEICVIACGHGVKNLVDIDTLIYRKGQQLKGKKKVEAQDYGTIVARGHVSFLLDDEISLGSTYEKEFTDDEVEEEYVEKQITKKISSWYHDISDIKDKQFVSGVRVGQEDTYLPLVKKLGEKRYLFTALGSRGLLYHVLYGKKLALMVKNDEER